MSVPPRFSLISLNIASPYFYSVYPTRLINDDPEERFAESCLLLELLRINLQNERFDFAVSEFDESLWFALPVPLRSHRSGSLRVHYF